MFLFCLRSLFSEIYVERVFQIGAYVGAYCFALLTETYGLGVPLTGCTLCSALGGPPSILTLAHSLPNGKLLLLALMLTPTPDP